MTTKRGKKLSEDELRAIVGGKIDAARNHMERFTRDRMFAQDLYEGKATILPSKPGRSSVVIRSVAESVDTCMPALMNVFLTSDEPVRFTPTKPEDEDLADQATELCKHVWYIRNNGAHILYNWMKSALLYRIGAIKIWWDESETVEEEQYEGLDEMGVQMLVQDPDIDIIEKVYRTDPAAEQLAVNVAKAQMAQQAMAQAMGMPNGAAGGTITLDASTLPMLCDVRVRRRTQNGQIKIQVLPPEELLIEPHKVDVDDRHMIGHRRRMTASELRAMGYPEKKLNEITYAPEPEEQEKVNRFSNTMAWEPEEETPNDPSSRSTWVSELYMEVDMDGDGKAERRKITVAGDGEYVILDNEIVDDHPFALLCPHPTPSRLIGQSVVDQVKDLQLLSTTLWRSSLDAVYKTINPRTIINENTVNFDDLTADVPGGYIRTSGNPQTDVVPMSIGNVAQNAMQMIAYVDDMRENRTGVTRHGAGLDPDALLKSHQGTGAVNSVLDASGQRLQLIARIFAETGVSRAFRRILDLATKHQSKTEMVRLRGRWVPMKPTDWQTQFDLVTTVGLGTGNRDTEFGRMMQLFQVWQAVLQAPGGDKIITPINQYNGLRSLVQTAGLRHADLYVTDPRLAPPEPPQPPQPDPNMALAQAQVQRAQIETQEKAREFDQQHLFTKQKAEYDLQLEMRKLELDHQIKLRKLELEALALQSKKVAEDADRAADMFAKQTDRDIEIAKMAHEQTMDETDREIEAVRTMTERERLNRPPQIGE